MKDFTEVEYRVTGIDHRSFQPHNDRAIEIIQTWSDGGYFLINDRIFPIESGAIYLINAVETHCSNPADYNRYNRSKIIVDIDFFFKVIDTLDLKNEVNKAFLEYGSYFIKFDLQDKLPYQMDMLFKQSYDVFSNPDEYSHATITCCMSQILIALLEYQVPDLTDYDANNGIINKVMAYINENIYKTENLSLDKISADTHVSKSYLCHLFKRTTGLSVMQYINNLRISQAKKLLLDTNMKIQDIALSLGFSSSTFFCKTFKANVGCSPAQYRVTHKIVV